MNDIDQIIADSPSMPTSQLVCAIAYAMRLIERPPMVMAIALASAGDRNRVFQALCNVLDGRLPVPERDKP